MEQVALRLSGCGAKGGDAVRTGERVAGDEIGLEGGDVQETSVTFNLVGLNPF